MDKNMRILMIIGIIFFLSGCAAPAYKSVFKDKPVDNARQFPVNKDVLYKAALRVFSGRNFMIEKEEQDKGFIMAKKSFQRGKKTDILVLQARLSSDEQDKTMLYITALQTTERCYIADHTRFFLWIVPLPGGGGKDASNIREGEKIIEDKAFYAEFFKEIEKEVNKINSAGTDHESTADSSVEIKLPEREEAVLEQEKIPLAEEGVEVEENKSIP